MRAARTARAPGLLFALRRMADGGDHAPGGEIYRDIRPLVRIGVSVVVEQDGRQESGSFGGGGRSGYETYLDPRYWHARSTRRCARRWSISNPSPRRPAR
jgi:hypothetical protein